MSPVQIVIERGADDVNALPDEIRKSETAADEMIENNVRKLVINEQPIHPNYYGKMSELLDSLV